MKSVLCEPNENIWLELWLCVLRLSLQKSSEYYPPIARTKNTPFIPELTESRKTQNLQESFGSPVPWERKGEGETPLTFSRGILVMPALCQVQFGLLRECSWVGNIQHRGLCVRKASVSQAVVAVGRFQGPKGNAQPFPPPLAPSAPRGASLSPKLLVLHVCPNQRERARIFVSRWKKSPFWCRCMNSQNSWSGFVYLLTVCALEFFRAILTPPQ